MSTLEIKQKIELLLQPILESKSAFLVDMQVRNERGGKLIQAFVDTDAGITIEQCAEINREFNRLSGVQDVLPEGYTLEVSSPGIDKPLRLLRQYQKNIGRKFKVRYQQAAEVVAFVGILSGLQGDELIFNPEKGEPLKLVFSQIIESKEVLPW